MLMVQPVLFFMTAHLLSVALILASAKANQGNAGCVAAK
jgi:hypothetical protein